MVFTITELEPERLFIDTARLPAWLSHEHRIETSDSGIEIRNRFVLWGCSAASTF